MLDFYKEIKLIKGNLY